jgi:hypothetical protein
MIDAAPITPTTITTTYSFLLIASLNSYYSFPLLSSVMKPGLPKPGPTQVLKPLGSKPAPTGKHFFHGTFFYISPAAICLAHPEALCHTKPDNIFLSEVRM